MNRSIREQVIEIMRENERLRYALSAIISIDDGDSPISTWETSSVFQEAREVLANKESLPSELKDFVQKLDGIGPGSYEISGSI